MICIPRFNISTDLPPPDSDPFIPQCGFCRSCFTTDEPFFEFERTTVTRVNETYVNLTCEVDSNIPRFSINWSISESEEDDTDELVDGGLIDEKPISIREIMQRDLTMISVLTAPDIVLEQDIRCTVVSSTESQSSMSGAFVEGNQ